VNAPALQRGIPLLVWIVAVMALFAIPFNIISQGFVPAGDARRHVAKVMTDKEYNRILVLRPEYKIDHSPGWDWILRQIHRVTGWEEDALMSFAVAALMLCILLAGLPWVRRPEAWLAALLVQLIAVPETMNRFDQARPFLLTEGIFICILFAWAKEEEVRPSWKQLILTTIGVTLSVWVHGAWYLWVFVLGGFLLAGAWRRMLWLGICWAAGVFFGALFSGRPVAFLYGAVYMAASVFHEHAPKWMLVGEFQPSDGEFYSLAVLALVYLWRRQQGGATNLLRQPVFWMIALFWVLGLQADRFWADWGLPAAVVWMALQFDDWLTTHCPADSIRRLLLCGFIAAPLYLTSTNDLKTRYSHNLRDIFLDGNDPALQGWLPEGDGIFYSADMSFFYDTFYKNPRANWRYLTGFEPALMPEDDLITLRKIQWNNHAWAAYDPWVKKMRPQDRLEIAGYAQPDIPELEWHAADGVWIGRKPTPK
jgi:hypothetical protein